MPEVTFRTQERPIFPILRTPIDTDHPCEKYYEMGTNCEHYLYFLVAADDLIL